MKLGSTWSNMSLTLIDDFDDDDRLFRHFTSKRGTPPNA
jgi:hypothetical protein